MNTTVTSNHGKKVNQQNLVTKNIMQGCQIAETSIGSIMAGAPSEIIKLLSKQQIELPSIHIIPNIFYQYGVLQAAYEFPLYSFLFMLGKFFKGEKMILVGQQEQLVQIKKALQITLLGPTEQQYKEWAIPVEEANQLLKISHHISLKKADGTIAQIDDMIEFIPFCKSIQTATLGNVTIHSTGINQFTIKDGLKNTLIDINLKSEQAPVTPINYPNRPIKKSTLAMTALSKCTNGFDTSGATTGLILWINGLAIAVDGIPWMSHSLSALGINSQEITGHILSHIHDDHSSILDMIVTGKTVRLITTKVIYNMFLIKTACNLGWKTADVEKMIRFVEVTPGEKFTWYGASFDFFYTIHSIPTIGFRVSVNDKSIVFSGDTMYGSQLEPLLKNQVISQAHYDCIQNIPFMSSEFTFFDVGGGDIHPLHTDLAKLPEKIRKGMVLTHINELPKAIQNQFSRAYAGQHFEAIAQPDMSANDVLTTMEATLFKGISKQWKSVIISQGVIREYTTGDAIIEQNSIGHYFSIILAGTVKVSIDDEAINELSTGDFFGEQSLMHDKPCNADLVAHSYTRVLQIPKKVFLDFIKYTYIPHNPNSNIESHLNQLHKIRPLLKNFTLFDNLPASVFSNIISMVEFQEIPANKIVIKQDTHADFFYGIIEGSVSVLMKKNNQPKQVSELKAGQFFGEIALLFNCKRTANIVAKEPLMVFKLSKQKFNQLIRDIPALYHQISIIAKQRHGQLQLNEQ